MYELLDQHKILESKLLEDHENLKVPSQIEIHARETDLPCALVLSCLLITLPYVLFARRAIGKGSDFDFLWMINSWLVD